MSERQSVISVKNVSKEFRVHIERNRTLKERVLYAGRGKYRSFIALDDVSIDIFRGESVGLIGVNGSGKSTLLKLMSRILYPDIGTVEVKGRVSSLLELGAGFHPDFTGRENIFMNGTLLGLSRKEIREKLNEIIDFSELGDFIDEPVRSYSSGMYMRLAFSVAVAVDPEIILIDEILAVGDAAFQAKCMNRLQELRLKNTTIVMVTHDTSSVERFCDRVIWMHDSHILMEGNPVTCINAYLEKIFKASNEGSNVMSFERHENIKKLEETDTNNRKKTNNENSVFSFNEKLHIGTGDVVIEEVITSSITGRGLVKCGEILDIKIKFRVLNHVENIDFGISIYSADDVLYYGTNTRLDRYGEITLSPCAGSINFVTKNFNLLPGLYSIDVSCNSVNTQSYDLWRKAAQIQVFSDRNEVGICRIIHEWNLEILQIN